MTLPSRNNVSNRVPIYFTLQQAVRCRLGNITRCFTRYMYHLIYHMPKLSTLKLVAKCDAVSRIVLLFHPHLRIFIVWYTMSVHITEIHTRFSCKLSLRSDKTFCYFFLMNFGNVKKFMRYPVHEMFRIFLQNEIIFHLKNTYNLFFYSLYILLIYFVSLNLFKIIFIIMYLDC